MKRFFFGAIIILLIAACGGRRTGELTGVQNRPEWFEPDPLGMIFVPMGSFNMGPNDADVPFAMNAKTRTVSIDPFWMDQTEITNNEYRQFVHWVRDSIFRYVIGTQMGKSELLIQPQGGQGAAPNKEPLINWDEDLPLDDPQVEQQLTDLGYYKSIENRVVSTDKLNTARLIYEYKWFDLAQAALRRNRFKHNLKRDYNTRSELIQEDVGKYPDDALIINHYTGQRKATPITLDSFVIRERVPVYPDTLTWMSDYAYSYNEPWTKKYFWHPAFDTYPAVGVDWNQARAFSAWRTKLMNNFRRENDQADIEDFRLPTEAEWEYAARGGLALSKYPWGGPYPRNNTGCFIANFKNMRGNYAADGANRTLEVGSFEPNDYLLYDMAGNVAEWTSSAYDESGYRFMHDLNPDFRYYASKNDPPVLKRKVVRGGSWKDVGYYLQCGVRTYEYQDTSKSYIGFRCVRSYLGRDAADWTTTSDF